jgi:protein-disulfide isomerase
MLHRPLARFVRVAAAAILLTACSTRDDSPPKSAAAQQVADSRGGDVAIGAAPGAPNDTASTLADKARIRGAATAPVWLVEISDFQCPFCKQWHDQVFATIDKEYVQTGKVRLAYLNFPLNRIHPNAHAAAEAAMCAGVQGKFWELHGSLFTTQARWAEQKSPMAVFDSLARSAGVDPKMWINCMTTHAMSKLIEADRDRSTKAGVESTPTFFIGDRALAGAYPVDTFRVVIDQAIAKASAPR